MNIKKLTQELSYLGVVKGKRQTYYVFKGAGFFLVFSLSRKKPNAGNFNVVGFEAVNEVQRRFAGVRGVTAKDVVSKVRRSRRLPNALAALNALYVLAATGRASIDTRRAGPKLFFNVWRRA